MHSLSAAPDASLSFVLWVGSWLCFSLFLAWAALPEQTLRSLGVSYYPSRYYALAVPAYLVAVSLLASCVYAGVNMARTLDPADPRSAYDDECLRLRTTATLRNKLGAHAHTHSSAGTNDTHTGSGSTHTAHTAHNAHTAHTASSAASGRPCVVRRAPARFVKCARNESIPDFGDIDPVELSKVIGGLAAADDTG